MTRRRSALAATASSFEDGGGHFRSGRFAAVRAARIEQHGGSWVYTRNHPRRAEAVLRAVRSTG